MLPESEAFLRTLPFIVFLMDESLSSEVFYFIPRKVFRRTIKLIMQTPVVPGRFLIIILAFVIVIDAIKAKGAMKKYAKYQKLYIKIVQKV